MFVDHRSIGRFDRSEYNWAHSIFLNRARIGALLEFARQVVIQESVRYLFVPALILVIQLTAGTLSRDFGHHEAQKNT